MNRLNQLNKFPTCIAVASPSHLIGGKISKEDSVIEKSLIIIKWASYIGIKYIVLYDPQGYFAARKTYFEDRIKKMFISTASDEKCMYDQSFSMESNWNNNSRPRISNGINNHEVKPQPQPQAKLNVPSITFNSGQLTSTVTVNFLSSEHSKKHMVMLAREFVEEFNNRDKKVLSNSISVDDVEERINRDFKFPEPELVIELCPAPCLLGLHPWRIKLTEIILLPQCSGGDELSVLSSLLTVLERYNKCEKRVGR